MKPSGSLFDVITARHDWMVRKVTMPTLDEWLSDGGLPEVYDRHKEALEQAERFVKDCKRNQYPQENDALYEALMWWPYDHRAKQVKDGKLPEFVSKMCKRFDRGSILFRDYVFELVGSL